MLDCEVYLPTLLQSPAVANISYIIIYVTAATATVLW